MMSNSTPFTAEQLTQAAMAIHYKEGLWIGQEFFPDPILHWSRDSPESPIGIYEPMKPRGLIDNTKSERW